MRGCARREVTQRFPRRGPVRSRAAAGGAPIASRAIASRPDGSRSREHRGQTPGGLLARSAKGATLSVGRRRRRQALVVDPRRLRLRGPSPTKPRRGLLAPPAKSASLRVGRRRRRQALVVDPRRLRLRGPSPTKPRRGLLAPLAKSASLCVGRRRGSHSCAPIPVQTSHGAPRRARDPAASLLLSRNPHRCVSAAGGDGKRSSSIPVGFASGAPRRRSRTANRRTAGRRSSRPATAARSVS